MAKGAQFDLSGFILQGDGSYKKKSSCVQPRDLEKKVAGNSYVSKGEAKHLEYISNVENINIPIIKIRKEPLPKDYVESVKVERSITLTLFGIPMPKQSVRSFIKDDNTMGYFQPQNTVDRKHDYIRQIKEQLPPDFVPFMTQVFVTKFHCIYPPLKSFHKEKGKMDRIRNGELFLKNTQPDLIDNLKKLIFDCLGKDKKTKLPLVLGNDGIIVGEDNTRKYHGIGGCIIIEMKGY